jgi:hypothetical protein
VPRSSKRTLSAAFAGAGAILATSATLGAAGALSAPGGPTVVADHVNNPRGLELGDSGRLFIAAAGRGGKNCGKIPQLGKVCGGATSSVLGVGAGAKSTVAGGFPSGAGKDGSFATGVDDVSAAPGGALFAIETYVPKPAIKLLPKRTRKFNGKLIEIVNGGAKPIADIARFELKHDPDNQGKDSNPYAVYAASNHTQYVADAAGNDILKVHNGKVSLVAVLKNVGKNQAVPTSITKGPGGDLYVGELIGESRPSTNAARIIRIAPSGKQSVYAKGLNRTVGSSFDRAGDMFVTELTTTAIDPSSHGAVIEIPKSGPRCTIAGSDQLIFPAGGVVTKNGSKLYVSNFSVLPASTPAGGPFGGAHGQVVSLPATCA